MTAKERLVAALTEALRIGGSGDLAEAGRRLEDLARDPEAAAFGVPTALGLPRKLHSARLKLAKLARDPAAVLGLQATAVPTETRIGDLFTADADDRATLVAAASAAVPRVLHQIWVGGPPPVACAAWAGYARRHGWTYQLWDEPALAAKGFTDNPLWRSMVAAGDLPGAVDVARYALLFEAGGLYLDCDWYPARADLPPEAVLPPLGLSVLAEPAPRLVAGQSLLLSNALIAAPPRHPALARLLAVLPEVALRLPGGPAWWVTGPLSFTLAVRRGPVTVLDPAMVAGDLPRGAPEEEAIALAAQNASAPGFLIAWKGW